MAQELIRNGPASALPGLTRRSEVANETVVRALKAVRSHLGMEIAYVSEFVNDRSVLREVDASREENRVRPGDSYSLDDVYCRHVLEGRLPELMPDTSLVPAAMKMPITRKVPVGAHVSVPIRLADGTTYGMFCCLSAEADPTLNRRDLQVMRLFADLLAVQISRDIEADRAEQDRVARITTLIEQEEFSIVYQPIVRLSDDAVTGLECLSRFPGEPHRGPDAWFKEAAEIGLGVELELAALRKGLTALMSLPSHIHLAVNISPQAIVDARFYPMLEAFPLDRIVLEITEHAKVSSYSELFEALRHIRSRGVCLSVDDAGAGYASFRHILDLRPDLIKLDVSLTRDIDSDSARRALAAALISFAHKTGSRIVAEGVETAAELAELRALGVENAQGYYLGRPAPLADAMTRIGSSG